MWRDWRRRKHPKRRTAEATTTKFWGSMCQLADASGAVLETIKYSPYGTPTIESGSASTDLLYAGQYNDPQSGLVYLRARWYDPTTGQFLSVDPDLAQTGATYNYAGDDPTTVTDPTGRLCLSLHCIADTAGTIVTDGGRVASTVLKYSPPGLALQAVSSLTGKTVGVCVGGTFSAGGSVSASLCYLATPSGQSGITATVGGGTGGPVSASASLGPVISNGQTLNDQTGEFEYGGASAGYGPFSGGVFGSEGHNACGSPIWDAGLAWTPNIGLGPPVSIHGGVSYTWAAPAW